jgi:hypothetical protein
LENGLDHDARHTERPLVSILHESLHFHEETVMLNTSLLQTKEKLEGRQGFLEKKQLDFGPKGVHETVAWQSNNIQLCCRIQNKESPWVQCRRKLVLKVHPEQVK